MPGPAKQSRLEHPPAGFFLDAACAAAVSACRSDPGSLRLGVGVFAVGRFAGQVDAQREDGQEHREYQRFGAQRTATARRRRGGGGVGGSEAGVHMVHSKQDVEIGAQMHVFEVTPRRARRDEFPPV